MGPCCYCKKMIYLEEIAERGYHRVCHEQFMNKLSTKQLLRFFGFRDKERDARQDERHRARRARSRAAKKARVV